MRDEIKVKVNGPRIEIVLGSFSDQPDNGPYAVVAMLHLLDSDVIYQPLMPRNTPNGKDQLQRAAAGDLLAEIYDFICERWSTPGGANTRR